MNLIIAKYELSKFIEADLNKLKNATSIADVLDPHCESPRVKYLDIVEKLDNSNDKQYLDRIIGIYMYESDNLRLRLVKEHYLNDEIFNYLNEKDKFNEIVYNLNNSTYYGYIFGFSLIINHPDDIDLFDYIEIWGKALRLIEVFPERSLEFLRFNSNKDCKDYKELIKCYEAILKNILLVIKSGDFSLIEEVEEIKFIIKDLKRIIKVRRTSFELLEELFQKQKELSELERNQIILDLEYLKKYPKTFLKFKRDFCVKDKITCSKMRDVLLDTLMENKKFNESELEVINRLDKALTNYQDYHYILVKDCFEKRR